MARERILVAGGGAAGFFGAITCAELHSAAEVMLLEKGPRFLSKVRISGGGRCNVTHACFDAHLLATNYPRGEQALLGPFQRFQPRDTVAWFENRGVKLKIEADGRIFPVTDSSETIIDCLVRSAQSAGVQLFTKRSVECGCKRVGGGFELTLSNGDRLICEKLLLATGGCRTPALGKLAISLGHALEPPVPSLFTLHIENPWLRELAGVSSEAVEVSVPGTHLRTSGSLLITHWGLSGPAVLKLSAWGARALHRLDYRFPLHVKWLAEMSPEGIVSEFQARRSAQPAKLVVNTPLARISSRLWEHLVLSAGIARDTRWSALSRAAHHQLVQQLIRTEFRVAGKSLNKDEFVTCGGVRLKEVNFKTMESRVCPGLYFAGELLDIDGITGGFNFQAAWTTGWIAGRAMAGV